MSGETDLLTIARALVSAEPEAAVDASLAAEARVKLLRPRAMEVLEDTLAKGAVFALARLGGARAIIRPDGGSAKPARVYDVRPVPHLAFGRYTFELLRWLTRTPLGLSTVRPFVLMPETIGDELVGYLALRLVAGRRFEATVAAQPGLTGALAWLGFARPIARYCMEPATPAFDALLASAEGRLVVECLAGDLAQRWAASIGWRGKDLLELEVAARIGMRERTTLDMFIDAAAKADRWDLATFLVEAARLALPPGVRPELIAQRASPPVRPGGTLRARTEARQRAGALFHVLPRIARHYEDLSLVRFIDDGYDVAQATLSSWSPLGREGFARGAAVAGELASLAPFTSSTPS
jgi:hypothetical protein